VGDEAGQDGIAVEPLPDEAIVVRYGEMRDQDLTVSVWAEHDDSGRWGLSVLCQANLTALQLVNMKPLRHRIFRVSTVGAVKGIGLDVLPDDEDAPHAWVSGTQIRPSDRRATRGVGNRDYVRKTVRTRWALDPARSN